MQDKIHGSVNFPALVTAITRGPPLSHFSPTLQTSEQIVKARRRRQKIVRESALLRLSRQVDGRDLVAGREIEDKNADAAAGQIDPRDQSTGVDVGRDYLRARRQDDALRRHRRHRPR